MISRLFSIGRSRAPQPAPPPIGSVPPGERIYAIGDIHGRLDLLDALLARIAEDERTRGAAATTLIFLGDLVDRGPESAGVVARLAALEADRPAGTTRFLLGNHEEVFLSVLSGGTRALRFFERIGGRETILSYGVTADEVATLDAEALIARLRTLVPPAHVAFLERFEDLILVGDYAFVHAGVRPDQPLGQQRVADLRWIRDEFLSFRGSLEKVIVHGHTIADAVEETGHRIGLDTGAFASGKLSAMGFEGDRRWILQTDVETNS